MLLSGAYGQLKPGSPDSSAEPVREVVARGDVVAEPPLASPGQRQEELESERRLGALHGTVDQVEPDRVAAVEDVVASLLERPVQVPVAPDEHGRAQSRRAQHLVRVPDDRVRELDACEQMAVMLGEQRRAAVRCVDVEPDAVFGAERADPAQVVVQARCSSQAATATSAIGRRPAAAHAVEGVGQPRRVDALEPVDVQRDHGSSPSPRIAAARVSE